MAESRIMSFVETSAKKKPKEDSVGSSSRDNITYDVAQLNVNEFINMNTESVAGSLEIV